MQADNKIRSQLPRGQHGTDVGEVHVVPEGAAVLAVIKQGGGDVLALLQRVVQPVPLQAENNTDMLVKVSKENVLAKYLVATGLRAGQEAAVLAHDLVHRVPCQLREGHRGEHHREEVRSRIDHIKGGAFGPGLVAKLVEDGHDGRSEVGVEHQGQAAIFHEERGLHVQFVLKGLILSFKECNALLKFTNLLFFPFPVVLGNLTIPFPTACQFNSIKILPGTKTW